jgi:hypothetical protein
VPNRRLELLVDAPEGYAKLYTEHMLGPERGADFHFLVGGAARSRKRNALRPFIVFPLCGERQLYERPFGVLSSRRRPFASVASVPRRPLCGHPYQMISPEGSEARRSRPFRA